jgi:hypothetical protein
LRRFFLHLLPERFVRVRHYGLHHSAARKTRLPLARQHLALPPAVPKIPKLKLAAWLAELLGPDATTRCHWCGAVGTLVYRGEVADMHWLWLWLKMWWGWWAAAAQNPMAPAAPTAA